MNRRRFMQNLPLGLSALALPFAAGPRGGLAFAGSPLLGALTNAGADTDRVLVLINLSGGNDGLNTVIPYEDPLYRAGRARTGFVSAAERAALRDALLAPGVALNPLMQAGPPGATFLDLWRNGRLGIVQNVGYPVQSRSHFRSTDIWNSASDSNVVLATGWLGRYFAGEEPNYPYSVGPGDDPLAVQIDFALSPVFQGPQAEMGLAVTDPTRYDPGAFYADDPPPDTAAGAEVAFVRSLLVQSDVYGRRFRELFAQGVQSRVDYPADNELALKLQKVAWCIASGMKTRVYFVEQTGYDTHRDQRATERGGTGQGELLYRLAEAIATFQADLERQGLSDRVVGLTYSEFGRRVQDNGGAGTDHGAAAPQFLFGAPVAGDLYGPMPDLADLDDNEDLRWKVDFRQLYAAVLGDWFGVSPALRGAVLNQPAEAAPFGIDFEPQGGGAARSLFRNPRRDTPPPPAFRLHANAPNPFLSATTIRFDLAGEEQVRLEVFDARGRRVRTLLNGRLGAGAHQADFEAGDLPGGVYFYRLESESGVASRKMLRVK